MEDLPFPQFQLVKYNTNEENFKYSVVVSEVVQHWIEENFDVDVDYHFSRYLKGVWCEMTEEVFVCLILKWD